MLLRTYIFRWFDRSRLIVKTAYRLINYKKIVSNTILSFLKYVLPIGQITILSLFSFSRARGPCPPWPLLNPGLDNIMLIVSTALKIWFGQIKFLQHSEICHYFLWTIYFEKIKWVIYILLLFKLFAINNKVIIGVWLESFFECNVLFSLSDPSPIH